VAHQSPGPATAAPLLAMLQPLDDALAPPWAFVGPHTVWPVVPDSRRHFARSGFRRSSRQRPLRLGPRSLDPDRSFWSAFAERIRDRTKPTDFCNDFFYDVRATQPGPLILAGTEAATSFLF